MISYGNLNIFFANIGRGDVGIGPYINSINRNLVMLGGMAEKAVEKELL